jgi:SAM-dependent methyltransferase
LERAGIKVFRNLSEAAKNERGTFQVITLFQVLEHIADFEKLLNDCRQLLMPGGVLVITVPDGDAMIKQEKLIGSSDMPPNHLIKWNPKSLSLVLKRSGFSICEPIPEPASMHKLIAALHLKVAADAGDQHSLAGKVYRIQTRPLRLMAMACLGGTAMLRLLPHTRQLFRGGAFAMIATAQ